MMYTPLAAKVCFHYTLLFSNIMKNYATLEGALGSNFEMHSIPLIKLLTHFLPQSQQKALISTFRFHFIAPSKYNASAPGFALVINCFSALKFSRP